MSVSGVPTLYDVAREAGVSLATASRVLNGSTRTVAAAYRTRVEAAAERLGYATNVSAQAIARGGSATIALLVADIADPYFSRIAAGVAQGAAPERLVTTIGVTGREIEREAELVRNLRGQRPRGIVLAASRSVHQLGSVLAESLAAIERAGSTIVAIGAHPGTLLGRTVSIADRAGASSLGRALADRGYDEAMVLAAAQGLVTSDDRVAGFVEGFAAGGGETVAVHHAGFTRDDGYRSMELALSRGVAPGTVVFAITDVVAIGAMSAIRDAGRTLGTDIAVAGFGGIPFSRDMRPTLTTVNAPLESLGEAAVQAVVAAEWDPPAPLPLTLALRESTPTR